MNRPATLLALSLSLAVPLRAAAGESPKAPPDARAAAKEGVNRGTALFWKGELEEARKEFQGVLKIAPRQPDALRFLEKIDDQYRRIARNFVVRAKKARLAAEKDVERFLEPQPNTPAGMKAMLEAVDKAAKEEGVPTATLDWFLARPSTIPFAGEQAEKQSKLKAHVKGTDKTDGRRGPGR